MTFFGLPSLRSVALIHVGILALLLFGCSQKQKPGAQTDVPSLPTETQDSVRIKNPTSPLSDKILANRDATMDKINDYLQAGDLAPAADLLGELLLVNPQDVEAIFYLANVRAEQGQVQQAIELLAEIPPELPEVGLAALGTAADWCVELEQFDEAENRYRKILELAPDANIARRQLAYLYNRQGRRHEAVQLIRVLCRSGDVTQDELHSLIVEADAMYDPLGSAAQPGTRPYWPIGPSGQARFEFTENRYAEAAELIEPLVRSGQAPPSVIAFYGRTVTEAQDDVRFAWWLSQVDDDVKKFPEFWAAIGTKMLADARFDDGLRALAEAVAGDPTDIRSTRRIIQAFRSLQNQAMVDVWSQRYQLLSDTVNSSIDVADNPPGSIDDLANNLRSLNRSLEAVMWLGIQAVRNPSVAEVMDALNSERLAILDSGSGFPDRDDIFKNWNPAAHPLPELGIALIHNEKMILMPQRVPQARIRNIAHEVGLEHVYQVSTTKKDHAFSIYQQNGGGIAVLDYDLDGHPDLYLAQGAAEPPEFIAFQSDQLLRTLSSPQRKTLSNITVPACLTEAHYTLGVTSGDWNQDGFADIAVANIGPTVLLINNGDGTFKRQMLDANASLNVLTTSLAIADINGDQLPDLFVLNYLDDEKIVTLPPLDGEGFTTKPMTPHMFSPALDQVWVNQGNGDSLPIDVGRKGADESYGLGLVVANFDDTSGNEIFVGNDAKANQLWSWDLAEKSWSDTAVPRGCAAGSLGAATASMGIATGDFDHSGSIDLHIANFYNESSSLYLNQNGLFRDLNIKYGIDRSSVSVLGFGCQAIDYSNDGWLDIAVGNGHIENLEKIKQPFRQKMQLLTNLGDKFVPVIVEDSSLFWSQPHVARCVARLDFNRDGQSDLVVNSLGEPTALLVNETSSPNHWIGFRLVGTQSERDSIGARVRIESENQNFTAWVTSGDGYLCKNENIIIVGLGTESNIKQVRVDWPSELSQFFQGLSVDQYILLIEGDPDPFVGF